MKEKISEYDVRLLSGTYTTEGSDLKILLFGKERGGRSITIVINDFRPYFRMVIPDNGDVLHEYFEGIKKDLEEERDRGGEVLDIKEEELYVDNIKQKLLKVTIKSPWNVPFYRKKYNNIRFCDADIPFVHRYIYDNDIASCVKVSGKEINEPRYTTDIVIEAESFTEISPFNPELKILAFDIENSIKNKVILAITGKLNTGEEFKLSELDGQPTEYNIINEFSKKRLDLDPDVITGYNIDGYDIPYIMERAKINGINRLEWGRNHDTPRSVGKFWRVPGRIIADAWWNVKKNIHPKRETLGYVSRLLLGEDKLDVNASDIDREWEKDRKKVVKYCLKDSELSLRILMKIRVLEKNMDLASVSRLPLEDVMTSGTSTLVDSLLIREAMRQDIAINTTHSRSEHRKNEKITGGFVLEPKQGLYTWVIVLDFKSMYPSIIISNNICFTTIRDDGDIVAPSGVRFTSKKKGIIPGILVKLMLDRDITKKRMKEAKNDGERNYYDGLQQAIKVVMNTFYGVLASSFYRFTNPDIGASITGFARENITGIIDVLEKDNVEVLYSDTDSIFVKSPHEELESTIEYGKTLAARFSKGSAVLEFEKILETYFTGGMKKRYFGKIAWPEEGIIIRGYETRRSDAFDYQSEILEKIMRSIMNRDIDDAIEIAKNAVNDILERNVSPEKLTISKTVQDERKYKDPDIMSNVIAARKMKDMGYEVTEGMKVAFIVTDSSVTPMEVEPYIDGVKFEHTPDLHYYAERLALSISRITGVFGIGQDTLMGRPRQMGLFDNFSDDNPGGNNRSPDNKRKTAKRKIKSPAYYNRDVTIDNFFE